ncbi:MAG TPA: hypothetical protein EYO01_08255 [Phycisphaerales bacterium]|nr:hypothetical protein [Phycisphaerales bacterium]
MKLLFSLHHKLHSWQQKKWSRILFSILLFAIISALLIPTLLASYKIHGLRSELYSVLTGPDQRIVAEEIEETGFVELSGVSYGDVRLVGFRILDENDIVIDPSGVTSIILQKEFPQKVPLWLLQDPMFTWGIGAISMFFLGFAIWTGLLLPLLYTATIATIGWLIFSWAEAPLGATAIIGMCILAFSYSVIITLLKLLFRSPRQVPALARGVLLEATRTRLSIAFVTLLLIFLPLVPLMLDPESPLRHRVQTFLSRSLGTTFTIAAFLTVFLGCATIAFEIRDRQIWQILTKPVSKMGYLFGKWLGVVSLNFAILTVAGISVFFYLQYLRTESVATGLQGDLDRLAVEEEILTARAEALPVFETLTNEQISARVDELIDADPDLRDEKEIQLRLRKKLRNDVQEQFLAQQRSIPPKRGGQAFSQTYRFTGLSHAKKLGSPLAFKYRFHIGQSDEHETYSAGLIYNEDPATSHIVTYIPTMTHVTMIPANLINDNGEISISVYNLYDPPPENRGRGAMSFDKGGVEIRYRVGDFESNFFRTMLVLWIKLAFLAALALAASTFLSFPVACMITLTVFATGTIAPYLSSSLQAYVPPPTEAVDWGNIAHIIQWGFENFIRWIASAMVYLLEGFGAQRPTDDLVDGMLVSWGSVFKGFVTIGIAWTFLALGIGTLILRKRQLAIYSGSG